MAGGGITKFETKHFLKTINKKEIFVKQHMKRRMYIFNKKWGWGKLTWEEFRELYKDAIFRLNLAKRFLKETEEVNGNRYLLGMSSYSYFHRIQILRYAQNNSEGGKSVTLDVVRGLRNPHSWLASPIIFALPLHTSP